MFPTLPLFQSGHSLQAENDHDPRCDIIDVHVVPHDHTDQPHVPATVVLCCTVPCFRAATIRTTHNGRNCDHQFPPSGICTCTQQQEAETAAAAAAGAVTGAVAEQQQLQTASSSMADLREIVVQYTSFLDSLHGASWSPLVDDTYQKLGAMMDDRLSGDRALGCAPDTEWLDCIILRSTLATSIVAYLESVPWESLTAAGLCELDTSFLTAMQACLILGRLLDDAFSEAGGSSPTGTLLLTQVSHHPL